MLNVLQMLTSCFSELFYQYYEYVHFLLEEAEVQKGQQAV